MNSTTLFICLISLILYSIIHSSYEKINKLKASDITFISFKASYLPSLVGMVLILLLIIFCFFYTHTYSSQSHSYLNLLFLIPSLMVIYSKNDVNKYAYFTPDYLIVSGFKRNYDDIFNIEISKETDKNDEYSIYIYINVLYSIKSYAVYIPKNDINRFKEMIGDRCKIIYR